MTPLERAAKAAAEAYGHDWDKLPAANPIANGEDDRAMFLEMVAAAIAAIREPSEAMLKSTDLAPNAQVALRHAWKQMIDAALEEG